MAIIGTIIVRPLENAFKMVYVLKELRKAYFDKRVHDLIKEIQFSQSGTLEPSVPIYIVKRTKSFLNRFLELYMFLPIL